MFDINQNAQLFDNKPDNYRTSGLRVLYCVVYHVVENESEVLFVNVQSLNSVLQNLDVLEEWGLITRQRHQHRSIELITPEQAKRGPVVLPVIASAGCDAMTIFAHHVFDDYLTVDRSYLSTQSDFGTLWVFRAIGDSMNGAGISSGDYVLVERTDDVGSGDRRGGRY